MTGDELKQLTDYGLTQDEIAIALSVSRSTINRNIAKGPETISADLIGPAMDLKRRIIENQIQAAYESLNDGLLKMNSLLNQIAQFQG